MRLKVLDRDGWRCVLCRKYGNEADHVTPLANGGKVYDLDNLQTLCRGCHIAKTRGENLAKPTPPEVLEWQRYLTRT